MQYINEISYVALVLSALGWFYARVRSVAVPFLGQSFWVSLLLYILSFFFADAGLLIKLFLMLPLDVAVFVTLILLFNRYVSKSKILFTLVAAVLLAVKFFFFDKAVQALDHWFDPSTSALAPAAQVPIDANGELLVDLKAGHNIAELQSLLARYGAQARPAFPRLAHPDFSDLEEYYVIDIAPEHAAQWAQIDRELMASGVIDWAETNETVQLEQPADARPLPSEMLYGLNDPGLEKLWGFKAMQMDRFFDLLRQAQAQPAKVAKIAILDTGVEADHEDLAANYTSTSAAYDRDRVGHGTHCAGIAGAVSNNGKGIASFSPDKAFARITSIKVLNDFGAGSQQSIIDGMIQAADGGADVISLSLGGPSNDAAQRAYTEAVKYANRAGAIVVVAAGNADENAIDYAPANVPGVITVAALDDQLRKAEFSNDVSDLKMAVAAPGVSVYSTFPGNQYRFLSGTSMATPYVAGLVGFVKAMRPHLSTQEVYNLLAQTAQSTPDGSRTGGLVQPAAVAAQVLGAQ